MAENQRQTHHRPVPGTRVGREPDARLHPGAHYIRFIFRRGCDNFATRADDRGHSVVGRAHHGPPGFHGAQPADLQVLITRRRMPEPGIIGDVGQHGRGAHGRQQGRPVGIFVTDAGGNFLAARIQRSLLRRAAIEIGVRQAHEPEPVAHELRHRERTRRTARGDACRASRCRAWPCPWPAPS